jgi:nucleoside-diphosphate-sugar epimerase
MGYHRFVRALLTGEPITVCGDGHQVRGNTYIDDCVEATVRAVQAAPGETYNVGGGEAVSVWDVLHHLETIVGQRAVIKQEAARPGDQRHTCADTGKLTRHFGWSARVGIAEGLSRQVVWQRAQLTENTQHLALDQSSNDKAAVLVSAS